MYMIVQLYQEKYLDDVLMALAEAGIEHSVVLSGESIGHKMTFDMPLFAGFRTSIGSEKGYAQFIAGFAEEEQAEMFLESLQSSGLDVAEEGFLDVVLLPIHKRLP